MRAIRGGEGAFAIVLFVVLLGLGAGCRPAESQEPPPRGRALFASVCARCHGADGGGGVAQDGGPAPRDLTDPDFQRSRTDDDLRQVIVKGRSKGAMPAFGTTFPDDDIDALVQQVRALGARGE